MSQTTFLGLDKLATGQASKDPTLNADLDALDGAIAGINSKNFSGATTAQTLTTAEARKMRHVFTVAGAAIDVKFPLLYSNNFFIAYNNSGFALTIKTDAGGSTGVEVANGFSQALWINGDNVYPVGIATGLAGSSGPWTPWTPTFTNLTIGNGTIAGRYMQVGKTVICGLTVLFGSTPTSISGDVSFTLPVLAKTYTDLALPLGLCRFFDASASALVMGNTNYLGGSPPKGLMRVNNAAGTYVTEVALSSTIPFTWAVNDQIATTFIYEAA